MNHEGSSFACGCAPFSNRIFFAKMDDEMADEDNPNSSFFLMDQDEWMGYDEAVPWPAMDMATVKLGNAGRIVVAVGPGAEYWEVDAGSTDESVGLIQKGETLRAVSAIDQVIYACGMGRAVFQRDAPGRWRSVGPTVPLPTDLTVVGFEGISGFSATDIFAVGWQGEIWRFDQRTWRQIDSPVSANLNAVFCAADGNVYVVGDNGVMLRGRNDAWNVIETGRAENLMDVTYYDGTVYVVTDFRILKLQGDTLVEETEFADANDRPATCLHLLPAEEGVISMGPKDLFRRSTGPWERLV